MPNSLGSKAQQFPTNSENSHAPKSSLAQPKCCSIEASSASGLARVDVSVGIDNARKHPGASNGSRCLRPLQTGDEDEEHCLRHVLQQVTVSALGAVELLGLGLQ